MSPARIRRLVFVLFFASGACGLVYEVVWTRMMNLVFGVTVYAATSVLCAFMAGLAIGSLLFGRVADRRRRPLVLYGLLEIGIAVYALVFPFILDAIQPLFVQIHRQFFGNYYLFSLLRFAVIVPALLLPAVLMGGTLPVVSRYFVRGQGSFGRDVSFLYAINTTGAVVGTFLVGFVLLATLGIHDTTVLAAAVQIAVGGIALWVGRRADVSALAGDRHAPEAASAVPVQPEDSGPRYGPVQARLALLAIGLSGVASLGLQVLWTRVLVRHTHNSTYAFSAILLVFLVGLSLGSWLYGAIAHRVRRPLALLAALEAGIGVLAVASVLLATQLPDLSRGLSIWITSNDFTETVILIFAQVAAIVLLPTILMGMTFPLATRIVTRSVGEVGRRVGDVYGVNTVGNVTGAFLVGFVLIPGLGLVWSFLLVAALNLGVAAWLLLKGGELPSGFRRAAAVACVAVLVAFAVLVPRDLFARMLGDTMGRVVFYQENVTDNIAVVDLFDRPFDREHRRPMKERRMLIFGDGRGTAGHGTAVLNRFYGHLPMLLHPDPEDVLMICVGAANTISAMVVHDRMESLECVDISNGVVQAAEYFESNYDVLDGGGRDPRIRVLVEDGRNYLLATDKTYDVIEVEPPELHTAGVVFLYTREFYEAARAKLAPGGIFLNWVSAYELSRPELKRVLATFREAFPLGTVWVDPVLLAVVLVGSDQPIQVPLARVLDLWEREPDLAAQLAADGLDDPMAFFSHFVMGPESLARYTEGVPPITDDRTVIDFTNPRSAHSGFGYLNIWSPHDHEAFQRGGGLRSNEVGPEQTMLQLNRRGDDPAEIIDWSGLPEHEVAAMKARLRRILRARNRFAAVPPGQRGDTTTLDVFRELD